MNWQVKSYTFTCITGNMNMEKIYRKGGPVILRHQVTQRNYWPISRFIKK